MESVEIIINWGFLISYFISIVINFILFPINYLIDIEEKINLNNFLKSIFNLEFLVVLLFSPFLSYIISIFLFIIIIYKSIIKIKSKCIEIKDSPYKK